jgi:hypothetical protein
MKYIAHTSSPLSPQTPYSSLSTLTLVLSHFNFWNLVLIFYRSSAVALLLAPSSTPLDFVSRSVVCLYRRPRTSVHASLSLILVIVLLSSSMNASVSTLHFSTWIMFRWFHGSNPMWNHVVEPRLTCIPMHVCMPTKH